MRKGLQWLKKAAAMMLAGTLCFSGWGFARADGEVSMEDLGEEQEENSLVIDGEGSDKTQEVDETVDSSVDPSTLEVNTNLPGHVVNILLVGIDTRDKDLSEGYQHGDVQIILSINKETGSVKLTSIMRDLYVTIPTRKNMTRINNSYAGKTGGGELAMRTVNHNFQMNIEQYVAINFFGLASIIDAIGGVDVELTKVEAGAINTYLRKHPPKYDNKDTKRTPLERRAGIQHLDGVQAVMYARLREIDNDFNRTARQRNLLDLLLKTIMQDMSIDKFITLVETSLPFVKTNASAASMLDLGTSVLGSGIVQRAQAGESLIEQMRIPVDDTWKYGTTSDGASVIMFRKKGLQQNVEALHQFIYGQYYPAP